MVELRAGGEEKKGGIDVMIEKMRRFKGRWREKQDLSEKRPEKGLLQPFWKTIFQKGQWRDMSKIED